MVDAWRDDLNEWLVPFVALSGDRRRERMCSAYVEGLIGTGDRKSVQPMALRSLGIPVLQLRGISVAHRPRSSGRSAPQKGKPLASSCAVATARR